jgi:hypothetical protein
MNTTEARLPTAPTFVTAARVVGATANSCEGSLPMAATTGHYWANVSVVHALSVMLTSPASSSA